MTPGAGPAGRRTDRRDERPTQNLAGPYGPTPDADDSLGHRGSSKSSSGRRTSLRLVRNQLSERDYAILRSVAGFRLMHARQIERLHFREGSALTQARRCRRSLERLHQLDLIARLERRIGGTHAGSAGYLYTLASRGRRLLELTGPAGGRRRAPVEATVHYQDHALAITELCVTLAESERRGDLSLVRFDAEPVCWRQSNGLGGETVTLKPDAYAVVADGEFETLSFVEVDLATEGRLTIRRKGDAYLAYARTGREQADTGVFPRVAFLVPNEHRARAVREALRPIPRSDELFVVGLLDRAAAVLSGGGS